MKKQLFIARPVKRYSAALLTSIILIVGIFDAKANDKTGKATTDAISYVGRQNNLLTFNVNYLNQTEDRVVLELSDEHGDVLYRRVYKDKEVNKNIFITPLPVNIICFFAKNKKYRLSAEYCKHSKG